jgi:putative exosortase-associated protein (TIGR04073 family)
MRLTFPFIASLGAVALLLVGCAGPERKFGRGLSNVTECARLGEIRRSMEQTGIWESPEAAYTTGLVRGINRSLLRTGVGLYEIVTFPFPGYDPVFLPENPVYPDSYRPRLLADPIWGADDALGFSGGDIMPWSPGSRFHIFDY